MPIYSNEENVQILVQLLKQHDIKNVIVSPGTTNISFVASIQSDDFFKVYSCVDERSAAYMACGLAKESGEPVVISCTGATASRNYMSGLTEAYYSKLPIIALTSSQHFGKIGQNVAQVIDRSAQLNDIVKKSVHINSVHTAEDRWDTNLKINDALLECRRNGGGPVHINIVTTYNNSFTNGDIPNERKISRYKYGDKLPDIVSNYDKVAVFIGNHLPIDELFQLKIESFCEKYNGIVLCDHTSNYNGKYKILGNLIYDQNDGAIKKDSIDLVISIGNVSGAYMGFKSHEVWRVNPDGEIRDTYKNLTKVFSMEEEKFFDAYNALSNNHKDDFYNHVVTKDKELRNKLNDLNLPFSNLWIAQNTINKLNNDSIVHLGILNTLRSWNFFDTNKHINYYCNTGGFGIDGVLSTAIGSSLCTDKTIYCFIGDLAFFYDMNALGNKNIKNNLKIMLINNGCGTEFHNYNHRAVKISEENNLSLDFFAADGHFGNKSNVLVKHYVEDLGFEYISATNKEEFLNNIECFVDENYKGPLVFEIFTTPENESKALKMVKSLEVTKKTIAKKVLGKKGTKIVKKVMGK